MTCAVKVEIVVREKQKIGDTSKKSEQYLECMHKKEKK